MPKCVCGRFIKPLGWASHRAACKAEPVPTPDLDKQWPFPRKNYDKPAPGVVAVDSQTKPPADADGGA